jgi:hypothetical protein
VTGKGQLDGGREDPHLIVGRRRGGRDHEGRFRQVGPARDGLHLAGLQARAVEHDSHRIAEIRHRREHINLAELARHGPSMPRSGPAALPG